MGKPASYDWPGFKCQQGCTELATIMPGGPDAQYELEFGYTMASESIGGALALIQDAEGSGTPQTQAPTSPTAPTVTASPTAPTADQQFAIGVGMGVGGIGLLLVFAAWWQLSCLRARRHAKLLSSSSSSFS